MISATKLSPNRYQQLITSQLKSVSQVDTEKFLIRDKDKQNSATFVFVIKMLSYYEQTIETFLLVTLPDIISGYFGHDTGGTEK